MLKHEISFQMIKLIDKKIKPSFQAARVQHTLSCFDRSNPSAKQALVDDFDDIIITHNCLIFKGYDGFVSSHLMTNLSPDSSIVMDRLESGLFGFFAGPARQL